MKLKTRTQLVEVPTGTYVIGDPCYSIQAQADWDEVLRTSDYFENPIATLTRGGKQYKVLGFRTAWGDGCYDDNQGKVYPVDSGCIGLVPVEIADTQEHFMYPSVKVRFDKPTLCENTGGVMKFGNIKIDTCQEDWWEDSETVKESDV